MAWPSTDRRLIILLVKVDEAGSLDAGSHSVHRGERSPGCFTTLLKEVTLLSEKRIRRHGFVVAVSVAVYLAVLDPAKDY